MIISSIQAPGAFRTVLLAAAASALFVSASFAAADQHGDMQHSGWGQDYGATAHHWQNGQRIGYNDWSSAQPVDYRAHHLRRPPHGYAWRESNGQYVLAAVATGVIASIILSNGH